MKSYSEILQLISVFIVMILTAITIYSDKFFAGRNRNYLNIFSAIILFLSFVSIEALLQVYIVKFYIFYGWNAIILMTVLTLILITPFTGKLFKIISGLMQPAVKTETIIVKQEIQLQQDVIIAPLLKEAEAEPNILEVTTQEVIAQELTTPEVIAQDIIAEKEITPKEIVTKPVKKIPAKKTTVKSKPVRKNVKTKGKGNAKH